MTITGTCSELTTRHPSTNRHKLSIKPQRHNTLNPTQHNTFPLQVEVHSQVPAPSQQIQEWPGPQRVRALRRLNTEAFSTLTTSWWNYLSKSWQVAVQGAFSACSVFSKWWMITTVELSTSKSFGRLCATSEWLFLRRSAERFLISSTGTAMEKFHTKS